MSHICIINFPNDKRDYSYDCMKSLENINYAGLILAREPSNELKNDLNKFIQFEPYVKDPTDKGINLHKFVKYTLKECLKYNNKLREYLIESSLILDLVDTVYSDMMIKSVIFVPSYLLYQNMTSLDAPYMKVKDYYLKAKYSMTFFDTNERIDKFANYLTIRNVDESKGIINMIHNETWNQECIQSRKRRGEEYKAKRELKRQQLQQT